MRTPTLLASSGLALLVVVAAGGCFGDEDPDLPFVPDEPAEVRFAAIGDMGTGEAEQAQVAAALARVCSDEQYGCDLVLGLGDLIYPSGASSPDDPQFDAKFEVPYADVDAPFWLVLGNHDNGGEYPPGPAEQAGGLGAFYATGNNAVAYSERADRASDKWHLPGRFYTFSEGPVDFIGLDTNTMLFYGLAVPPDLSAGIQEQESWLPDAVDGAGDNPWKIAMGHHPYISNGEHGDAGAYDGHGAPGAGGDHLKALFDEHLCDHLDIYLAGHDHNLQWLEPTASCGRTALIVSGGGGAHLYELPGTHPAVFQASSLGFFWIHIEGTTARIVALDGDGNVLHEGTMAKPIQDGGEQ